MEPKERIILALDIADPKEAIDIVKRFKEHVNIFKVGSELFTSAGPRIIDEIHAENKKVFLDLKYHDIPTTVSRTARVVANLGVFMFNVHTLGGLDMMKQTAQEIVKVSLKQNIERPLLLGVTILTSLEQAALTNELGIVHRINTQVKHLAKLALKAGLDGVIASPQELEMIRSSFEKGFLIVTPGIRPIWTKQDDQKRTMPPKKALARGADYIILGRAVMSQPDPVNAIKLVLKEIEPRA